MVLPFSFCFALVSVLAGNRAAAAMLLVRSYLSAFAALLLIATTPMPDLIAGLEWLRAPRFLIQVMQFLYRYLIVLVEEASAMKQASLARAGSIRTLQFHQASGRRAESCSQGHGRGQQAVHRAMVSRGFEGRIPARSGGTQFQLAPRYGVLAAAAVLLIAGLRAVFR